MHGCDANGERTILCTIQYDPKSMTWPFRCSYTIVVFLCGYSVIFLSYQFYHVLFQQSAERHAFETGCMRAQVSMRTLFLLMRLFIKDRTESE